jgi:hypothetical protein
MISICLRHGWGWGWGCQTACSLWFKCRRTANIRWSGPATWRHGANDCGKGRCHWVTPVYKRYEKHWHRGGRLEQFPVLFPTLAGERPLKSTSSPGKAKIFWRTVQYCKLSLVYSYRMYFVVMVILPGMKCTQTGLLSIPLYKLSYSINLSMVLSLKSTIVEATLCSILK